MLCARFDLPPTAPKGFDEAETVKPFDVFEGVAMLSETALRALQLRT